MGNSSQKAINKKIQWNHPYLTNVILKKDEHIGYEFVQALFPMNNKNQFVNWVQQKQNNPCADDSNALNPINYKYDVEGFCGENGLAKVDYENYQFILTQQIFLRRGANKKYFQENQLIYLLYCLCKIAAKFHAKDMRVGDIQPENIFLNSEGTITIGHIFSYPGAKINYERSLHERVVTYIAPEETDEIHIGRATPTVDFMKAESFSVGLTMIDAALLDTSKKIYDRQLDINFEVLNSMKQNIQKSAYSAQFKKIVLSLTEEKAQNRISLSHLSQKMEPFVENIINLEEFPFQQLLSEEDNNFSPQYFFPNQQSKLSRGREFVQRLNSPIQKPSIKEIPEFMRERQRGQNIRFNYISPDTKTVYIPTREPIYQYKHPQPQYQHQDGVRKDSQLLEKDMAENKGQEKNGFEVNPSITSQERKLATQLIQAMENKIKFSRQQYPSIYY